MNIITSFLFFFLSQSLGSKYIMSVSLRKRKEELKVGAQDGDGGERSREEDHQDHRVGEEEAVHGRADLVGRRRRANLW